MEVLRSNQSNHLPINCYSSLVIYVENAGDFVVPLSAVESVHSQKVILSCGKLERRLRQAIGHAHDAEEPNA